MAQRDLRARSDDDLFADWRADIERIHDETVALFWNRRVFREVRRVFARNPKLQEVGGHIWEWLHLNYASTVLLAVRREVDDQPNTVNLRQLLSEIEARPGVLTRTRYLSAWNPRSDDERRLANRGFEQFGVVGHHGDQNLDHFDPAMARADRESLEAEVESVTRYANRTIAHRGRVGPRDQATHEDVNRALAAIESCLTRYYALLTQRVLAQTEPTAQYNTHEVYTFPWDVVCYRDWTSCPNGHRPDWRAIDREYAEER